MTEYQTNECIEETAVLLTHFIGTGYFRVTFIGCFASDCILLYARGVTPQIVTGPLIFKRQALIYHLRRKLS